MQSLDTFKRSYLGILVLSSFTLSASAVESTKFLNSELITSYGSTLDPKDKQSSFSFEPDLLFHLAEKTKFELYSFIDRPTDPYKNFTVPMLSATASQNLDLISSFTTSASLSVAALSLDRFKAEGYHFRIRPAFLLGIELVQGLSISGRIGPYLVLSEYKQYTNGVDKPRYGLNERLLIHFDTGRVSAEAGITFDQSQSSLWKNDYSTSESIQYNFTDSLALGFSHSLLASFIDDSTGMNRSFQFFDSRQSRVSVYLDLKL